MFFLEQLLRLAMRSDSNHTRLDKTGNDTNAQALFLCVVCPNEALSFVNSADVVYNLVPAESSG